MSQFPVAARLFIWSAILAGLALVVWLNWEPRLPTEMMVGGVLLALFLASVLSDLFHVHLNYKVEITLSTASNFAALLIFGLPYGVAIGAASSMTSDFLLKKAWYKVLFNTANTAISIACGGAMYWLASDGSLWPLSSIRNAVATVVAGSTYLVVNWALVSVAVGLATGVRPLDVAKSNLKGVSFQSITLIPLGMLIVIVYQANPWALALLLFPILLVHYSFDNYQKLRSQSMRTIELLASTIDRRDGYTFRHSQRVAEFVEKIAQRLYLGLYETEAVVFAARVHDLGKVSLDANILLKPSNLTPEEQSKVEEHPVIGAEIISQLSIYSEVKEMVTHHHERYDGKGYPAGLKGNNIPLGARIIAVADAFEAMTSDRSYRRAMSLEEAMAELKRCQGSQFDPAVVDAFLAILTEETADRSKQTAMEAIDVGVG